MKEKLFYLSLCIVNIEASIICFIMKPFMISTYKKYEKIEEELRNEGIYLHSRY